MKAENKWAILIIVVLSIALTGSIIHTNLLAKKYYRTLDKANAALLNADAAMKVQKEVLEKQGATIREQNEIIAIFAAKLKEKQSGH
jgi:predicted lysophospholipase L1 biosynthesis ABC-type transport system permease subunit